MLWGRRITARIRPIRRTQTPTKSRLTTDRPENGFPMPSQDNRSPPRFRDESCFPRIPPQVPLKPRLASIEYVEWSLIVGGIEGPSGQRPAPTPPLYSHQQSASDEPDNEDNEDDDVSQHLVSSVVVTLPVVGMVVHQSSVFSGTNW